jgi:hypothetical protein
MLYRYLRDYREEVSRGIYMFLRNLVENLKFFLYGIRLPSSRGEDYPLHAAVYENRLLKVQELVSNDSLFHL